MSDFVGREDEFQQLGSWVSSSQAVSAKFIIGDGGVGKSRLAAQFAEGLNKREWAAGFVDLRKPASFLLEKQGTLLVIDYPEESVDDVAELLRDLAMLSPEGRFRVLFLTRQKIDDWQGVIDRSRAEDIVDRASLELGRVSSPSGYELYYSALERVAEEKGTAPLPLSEESFVDWTGQSPENSRALFILAAAVHSVLNPEEEAVRYSGREIIGALVKREIRRLREAARSRGMRDLDAFARLLAMTAIAGELHSAEIMDLVRDSNLQLGLDANTEMREELRTAGVMSGDVVVAPKPDIAAAAFTVNVLSRNVTTASEIIWASLKQDLEESLNRFARLAYDAEIVLGMHEPKLSKWLSVAVSGNLVRCKAVEPYFSDVTLPIGWADAAVVMGRTFLEGATSDEERARLQNNLSAHLSAVGDRTGALDVIRESVRNISGFSGVQSCALLAGAGDEPEHSVESAERCRRYYGCVGCE